MNRFTLPVLLLTSLFGLVACGSSNKDKCTVDTSYDPVIDPTNFTASTTINNPLLSFIAGTTYSYVNPDETIEVTVSGDTKDILGVTCVVVRDTVKVNGKITEDTYDWYAQDNDGNVWYMGEDTKEYQGDVVVSTEGSWEAGVNGAKPGIVMHATQPAAGEPYHQEYSACNAEDMAEVVSLDASVTVPYGQYSNCLQTREFTPLESDVNEYKYYCQGVGLVLEQDVASGARTELTAVTVQ